MILSGLYSFAQGTVYEPSEAPVAVVQIGEYAPPCNPSSCTTLTADYFKIKPTNAYVVKPLTYQNLFSYTGGTVLNANGDDNFSSVFNLPFKFCFYGQIYDKVIIGTNGFISFNAALALQPTGYIFNTTIPSTSTPEKFKNSIYGVYQDTNIASPPVQNLTIQNVNYYTGGVAPNRYFVANFNRLPQFSCGGSLGNLNQMPDTDSGLQTTQIVIYETTNIIDVIVYKRIPCMSWEQGRGTIGIQNATGSAGLAPPGRNTGSWSVLGTAASPSEAWRFIPNGADPNPPLVKLEWFNQAGDLLGTGESIVVCPDVNQTYKVVATYDRCGQNDKVIVEDEILVEIADPFPVEDPQDMTICNDVFPATVNINQDTHILDGADPFDYDILYFYNEIDAQNQADSQAIPTNNGVTNITITDNNPVTIYVLIREPFGGVCINVRPFTVQVGTPAGSFSYPDPDGDIPSKYCFNSNNALAPVFDPVLGLTSGGIFTVNPPTGLIINPTTGVLDLTGAQEGTYTINYDIEEDTAPGGCPAFNANTIVIIESCISATVSNSGNVCQGTPTFDLFANYTEVVGATTTYEWKDNDGNVVATTQNPTGIPVPSAAGTYNYSLVITQNGAFSNPFTTTLIVHPTPTASFVSSSTTICTNATTTILINGTPNSIVNVNNGSTTFPVNIDATGNGSFTTPSLAANTTYTLVDVTGTTVPPCSSILTGSITISVGLPTATIVGFTNPVICSGTSTGLEIQGTPNAIVSYTIGGIAQPDVTIPASGIYIINTGVQTVTATTSYIYALTNVVSNSTPPCSSVITGQSATLTVNALPTATFSAVSTNICQGTSAVLNFVGTPNAIVTYTDGTQTTQKKHSSTQAAARTRKPPPQKHSPHQRTQKRHNDEV